MIDPTAVPDGVPHLTEHLLFESTQHLGNGDVDRLLRLAEGGLQQVLVGIRLFYLMLWLFFGYSILY